MFEPISSYGLLVLMAPRGILQRWRVDIRCAESASIDESARDGVEGLHRARIARKLLIRLTYTLQLLQLMCAADHPKQGTNVDRSSCS